MTYRDELLEVVRVLARHRSDGTFSLHETVRELQRQQSSCPPGAVRRHLNGVMCKNAPAHLGQFPDLERIRRGWYRLV